MPVTFEDMMMELFTPKERAAILREARRTMERRRAFRHDERHGDRDPNASFRVGRSGFHGKRLKAK